MRVERVATVQRNDIGAAEVAGQDAGFPLGIGEVMRESHCETRSPSRPASASVPSAPGRPSPRYPCWFVPGTSRYVASRCRRTRRDRRRGISGSRGPDPYASRDTDQQPPRCEVSSSAASACLVVSARSARGNQAGTKNRRITAGRRRDYCSTGLRHPTIPQLSVSPRCLKTQSDPRSRY